MWILWLVVPAVLAALTTILFLVPITRWYTMALMAKFDFVFTNVPESYFKEVVRFGGHKETLLSKAVYTIHDNGYIEELEPGEMPETSLPGGLRFVGLPFIDRIYKGRMKFSKSLPNGEIKDYDVENVDKFYAKVDYPYALPFVKCEDKNNLPLLGHATLLTQIVNPTKSLFATANFYDTMVGLVLPSVRECLKVFTFDEIKVKDDLDEIIWAELNATNPDVSGDVSVIDKLRDKYGIVIVAFRIVNIDPPTEYRDITLTKWKAEREADAAEAVATAESRKAAGPIDIAMEKWVKSEQEYEETPNGEKKLTETIAAAKKRLRASGEYKEHKALLADQINRSRRTVQERKVDVTSGGEPLKGGSIASIAGTIVGAVIAATAGKDIKDDDKDNPGGQKNPQGSAGSTNPPSDNPADAAERYFKLNGKYPPWDPLKRKP